MGQEVVSPFHPQEMPLPLVNVKEGRAPENGEEADAVGAPPLAMGSHHPGALDTSCSCAASNCPSAYGLPPKPRRLCSQVPGSWRCHGINTPWEQPPLASPPTRPRPCLLSQCPQWERLTLHRFLAGVFPALSPPPHTAPPVVGSWYFLHLPN